MFFMTSNSVKFLDLLGSEFMLFSPNPVKHFHCQEQGSTLPFAGYDQQ